MIRQGGCSLGHHQHPSYNREKGLEQLLAKYTVVIRGYDEYKKSYLLDLS